MSESVAYLIIRRPYISIDTGANLSYGIVAGLKYNYTYWSDPTDTFAHSLQSGHRYNFQGPDHPSLSQIPCSMIMDSEEDSIWNKSFHTALGYGKEFVKGAANKAMSYIGDKLSNLSFENVLGEVGEIGLDLSAIMFSSSNPSPPQVRDVVYDP